MTSKNKPKREADPDVLTQLREWAALKTRVVLEYLFGWTPLALAGELHLDQEHPDAFFFTTWSREIMVTLMPDMYESQSLKREKASTSVTLRGFGGEIAITELTGRTGLLLAASPPPSRIQ